MLAWGSQGILGRELYHIDGWLTACYSLEAMTIITLLTDFGLKDGYVGVMKGVIWGIAPRAQLADITHQIQPQNVAEGALALGRVAPYFPAGTIHLAVVDPGVGTRRRPIAARLGEQFFVGPDNGLCTVLVEQARQIGALLHSSSTWTSHAIGCRRSAMSSTGAIYSPL